MKDIALIFTAILSGRFLSYETGIAKLIPPSKSLVVIAMLASWALISPVWTLNAFAEPPKVICVPATAINPAIPHDIWSGLEITLKGTAHDPDGDNTLATYEWDFGDGSPVETGSVTDPYVIEARHTYVGNIGNLFIASLSVTDTSGESSTDQYLVQIKDAAELAVKVNVAIDEGLWRLHKDQFRWTDEDGELLGVWLYPSQWALVAATGASTEAFEVQGSLPSGNPNEDPYVETVQRGLNYILFQMQSHEISQDPDLCPAGNPDTNSNGFGLESCFDCWHSMYESGIALMALASSRCPYCVAATGIPEVKDRTYLEIAKDMVDYFAYAQTDPSMGDSRGGWRYHGNFRDGPASDNSVSQWPVIGMESAEVNFGPEGLVVPQFVKDELNLWIDYIQNDTWGYGGSGYTNPDEWVNVAKTGGLLAEMKFFGDTAEIQRVQNAIDYISSHWDSDTEHFPPANSYYAFYSVMKGLRLLEVETLPGVVYDTTTWKRVSGSDDDILGDWQITENGYILQLTFNSDGTFQLSGEDSCYPPARTASGTYSYDSVSGTLSVNIMESTLTCDVIVETGAYEFSVTSITDVAMVWTESSPPLDWYADPDRGYAQHIVSDQRPIGDTMTWARESGIAGYIEGTWTFSEFPLQMTLDSEGNVVLSGEDPCGPGDANGTYVYDPLFSHTISLDITSSDFTCSVEPGTQTFDILSIEDLSMTWSDPSDGAWTQGYWSVHPLTSAWAILTLKKTVVQPGPVANAGPDVPNHPPIIEITFDGTASFHNDPSRSIINYSWDFGDGSPPVEGAIVKHAFPAVYKPDGSINWAATTGDYTVTLEITDDSSPALADSDTAVVHITPPPYPPVADADGPYTAFPCASLSLNGSGSYDPNGAAYPDPGNPWHGEITDWEWDLDNDGIYNDETGKTISWSSCTPGIHVVGLRVTNTFGVSDEDDTVILISEEASQLPVSDPNGPYVGAINTPITFDGSGSFDPDGDALTYNWYWGDESNSLNAGVNPSHSYSVSGIYDVCLTVNDGIGGTDTVCTYAVVHDPSVGFVTGGGWINSQAGAYAPDPSLYGRANFGFVAKYQKGANVPVGQTEFQFQVADLNFHSEAYEWLLINQNGTNAQFKGSGTINGNGNYKFILWAGDNVPDTFRIKIWMEGDSGSEDVIYDNGFGHAIEGGSIVIHLNR